MTDARIVEGGVYSLIATASPARIVEAGVYSLIATNPIARVTGGGVYTLCSIIPCAPKWSEIWYIRRVDGTEYRFTSHDRNIDHGGEIWNACNGLKPTASESASEIGSVSNTEIAGVIATSGIDDEALYSGRFDGAYVEQWLIDRDRVAPPRLLQRGTFGRVRQRPDAYSVELLGDGARMQQTPLIRTVKPGCRHEFGSTRCGKDLGPLTVTGTIDSSTGPQQFIDAARAEGAGYFRFGKVTFTSGANEGVSVEIKEHLAGGEFQLWPRLGSPPAAGDTYSMHPGCTLLKASDGGTNGCLDWGMIINYGGYTAVPGGDAVSKTPDAK